MHDGRAQNLEVGQAMTQNPDRPSALADGPVADDLGLSRQRRSWYNDDYVSKGTMSAKHGWEAGMVPMMRHNAADSASGCV